MELALWRWSVGVQVTSLLMIWVFFLALGRSRPRHAPAAAAWVRGWALNVAALGATLAFWLVAAREGDPEPGVAFVRFFFTSAKSLSVLYLVQGGWSLLSPSSRLVGPGSLIVAGVVYPLAAALSLRSVETVGVAQQLFLGLMFVPTAIALARAGDGALAWLSAGYLARGSVAIVEAGAYALRALPDGHLEPGLRARLDVFLAVHSSFDAAADWLLALGFVLAVSLRAESSLTQTISELRVTQEGLRRLVDRDPLTALLNRRALPAALRAAQPAGATLLFMDLDGFKRVNDEHGHEAGDRILKRFAQALAENFRPDDTLIRYGGDEFLVVAPGLDRALAETRVEDLRNRLAKTESALPPLRFSVGLSTLPAGGRPDDALRAADEAMYAAKERRPMPGPAWGR